MCGGEERERERASGSPIQIELYRFSSTCSRSLKKKDLTDSGTVPLLVAKLPFLFANFLNRCIVPRLPIQPSFPIYSLTLSLRSFLSAVGQSIKPASAYFHCVYTPTLGPSDPAGSALCFKPREKTERVFLSYFPIPF